MSVYRAIVAFAARERSKQLPDVLAKINRQGGDRANLNHDGVHLPVAVLQADVQQIFSDAQMRRGADRQKLRQPFDNSQHDRHQIIVQVPSDVLLAYTNATAEL